MADFCRQCSIDLFKEDFRDLAGLTEKKDWELGRAAAVICESCGFIQVDPEGNCASSGCLKNGKPGHGIKWKATSAGGADSMSGWIGVDLDGTLAWYEGWKESSDEIGAPIPAMVDRVKKWLEEGREVRIFTARAAQPAQIPAIKAWCRKHLGVELAVTNCKDSAMRELWDDRCVQVQPNTGQPVHEFWRHVW